MSRQYSHHEERSDRRNDRYEPYRQTRRRSSSGEYWSPYGSSSSRRSSGSSSRRQSTSEGTLARRPSRCYSRRESVAGGFLARSISSTSLSRYSPPISPRYDTRRSGWELDMERYFESLRQDRGGQRDLDPIVDDLDVRSDRQARGHLHRSEYVANQFDVALPYVRELLHHMHDNYDTVTCYSLGLVKPGDIIYYIEPFVLGFDQVDEGEAVQVLGGSRFQAAVQAKGRFGIVTHKIGRQTLKVAPMYTFNGDGLASKRRSIRDEYLELGMHSKFTWDWTDPKMSPQVERVFCSLKPSSAVHLVTSRVTLSSQILIAGSVTSRSLDVLRDTITAAELHAEE